MHMTSDRQKLLSLLYGTTDYFARIHSRCHFGATKWGITNDRLLDTISISRISKTNNKESLLDKTDSMCSDPSTCTSSSRIYGITFPVYGLSSFVGKMKLAVQRLQRKDVTLLDEDSEELRFISSAMRHDLREGIDHLTETILDTGLDTISLSITIIIIMLAGLFVVDFGTYCFCALGWKNRYIRVRRESEALIELLPIDQDEPEMVLHPTMITNYPLLDQGRNRIIEACVHLMDSVLNQEGVESISVNSSTLLQTAQQSFVDEEKDMMEHDYDEEKFQAHRKEHLLLRQRLTYLCDLFMANTDAYSAVGRRRMVSVFDKHFTETDIEYANTIPESEKRKEGESENEMGGVPEGMEADDDLAAA